LADLPPQTSFAAGGREREKRLFFFAFNPKRKNAASDNIHVKGKEQGFGKKSAFGNKFKQTGRQAGRHRKVPSRSFPFLLSASVQCYCCVCSQKAMSSLPCTQERSGLKRRKGSGSVRGSACSLSFPSSRYNLRKVVPIFCFTFCMRCIDFLFLFVCFHFVYIFCHHVLVEGGT